MLSCSPPGAGWVLSAEASFSINIRRTPDLEITLELGIPLLIQNHYTMGDILAIVKQLAIFVARLCRKNKFARIRL